MKKLTAASWPLLLCLAACTTPQALLKPTTSGYAEGLFQNSTIEAVRSKLVAGCSSWGLPMQESSDSEIVCGKTLEGKEAYWAKLLVGDVLPKTLERKLRFTIRQKGPDVAVVARHWIHADLYGKIKNEELNTNKNRNNLQKLLFSMGAE